MLQPARYHAKDSCRPLAEQEETSRVCCSLSALYSCGFLLGNCFFVGPCDPQSWGGLCYCALHENAATGTMPLVLVLQVLVLLVLVPCWCRGAIFVGSRVFSRVPGPPSVAAFRFLYNIFHHYCTARFRVSRLCVRCFPRVTRGALSKKKYRQSSVFCGRSFRRLERHNKEMH